MHRLTVTLKQHTPLIHFQHDQEGATLRASEVKPKLDRFILTQLGGDDGYEVGIQIAQNNGWLVGKGDHPALDYKMRIKANAPEIPTDPNVQIDINKKNGKPILKKSPMFFANMGEGIEPKYYVKSSTCRIIILVDNDGLYQELVNHLGAFFYRTNFGTRQTKGYGSFTVQSSNPVITNYLPSKLSFSVEGNEETVFAEMEWIHKALRSGINDCFGKDILYFKSLMFAFAKSKGLQWDKKTIKQKFYPKDLESQNRTHPNNDVLTFLQKDEQFYDFRDCLGFSTVELWKRPYDVTIEKSSCQADRLKSPITFKPVNVGNNKWKVYLVREEIPSEFKGITINVKDNKNHSFDLKTPSFLLAEYINFVFKKNNNGQYSVNIRDMLTKGENTYKGKRILQIFNELRTNFNA